MRAIHRCALHLSKFHSSSARTSRTRRERKESIGYTRQPEESSAEHSDSSYSASRSDCPNRAAGTVQGRFEVGDSCGPALPDVGTVSFYHADKMPLSPLFGPVGR